MKTKLNVKLIRKIQRHITEEPRRFFMGWYLAKRKNWKEVRTNGSSDLSKTPPPCGTAACIAGWANIFSKNRDVTDTVAASKALGLNCLIANVVFYDWNWPAPFGRQYEIARNPKQRAKIACARLDHLIKTGE